MILHHGTTRQRAEAIVRDGPSLDYIEEGGDEPANGFATAPATGPFWQGNPAVIAKGKALEFRNEGGAVILEIDWPDEIAALAGQLSHPEFRFEPGYGYAELMDKWHSLPKRIIPL